MSSAQTMRMHRPTRSLDDLTQLTMQTERGLCAFFWLFGQEGLF